MAVAANKVLNAKGVEMGPALAALEKATTAYDRAVIAQHQQKMRRAG